MQGLTEHQLILTLVTLAVLLVVARAMGAVARRLNQPEVIGELVAGFLLGPSVLGRAWPAAEASLFREPAVVLALSAFSWVGAILLLLVAGFKVDLGMLKSELRAGSFAAVGAVVPSIAAGFVFGRLGLRLDPLAALLLGIVLSVTAVSVVARIFIEREQLRRRFAQVALAAGIASELLVWVLVAVASAARASSPLRAAVVTVLYAAAFFVLVATVGRRLVFRWMRLVTDEARIAHGPMSLVLALVLLAGAATAALGLHPLLGAFVLGVLLGQAPRARKPLMQGIHALTSSLFAPVFFALAGSRVDIGQLQTPGSWGAVAALLVVATLVKTALAGAGARLGAMRWSEAAVVGAALNVKGGTDVVVALIGLDLGLLPARAYTTYAVVAIVTALFSPALLAIAERRAPASPAEAERIAEKRAAERAYVPGVERVLVPVAPHFLPGLAAELVRRIAVAKRTVGELVDITELVIAGGSGEAGDAIDKLERADRLDNVEISAHRAHARGMLRAVVEAASGHDLIALGARVERARGLSFGRLQDAVIRSGACDTLLVAAADGVLPSSIQRVLAPVNGLAHSLAAFDLAAYVARACDAELVAFNAVHTDVDSLFWRERDHRRLRLTAQALLDEAIGRVRRLGVRATARVLHGEVAAREILRELARVPYDLLVLGAYDRGGPAGPPSLGHTVEQAVTRGRTPSVVLVSASERHAAE